MLTEDLFQQFVQGTQEAADLLRELGRAIRYRLKTDNPPLTPKDRRALERIAQDCERSLAG